MQQKLTPLLTRWLLNSLGLYLAVTIFGTGYAAAPLHIAVFLLAGLILSVVNTFLRPYAVIFSLPMMLPTYGLFTVVVNGVMVYLAVLMTPYLHIGFGHAILAGIVLTLVNYTVSIIAMLPVVRRFKEVRE